MKNVRKGRTILQYLNDYELDGLEKSNAALSEALQTKNILESGDDVITAIETTAEFTWFAGMVISLTQCKSCKDITDALDVFISTLKQMIENGIPKQKNECDEEIWISFKNAILLRFYQKIYDDLVTLQPPTELECGYIVDKAKEIVKDN